MPSDAVSAIRNGDLDSLRRLLDEDPSLATSAIAPNGRTPLHVATDWPGHYPNGRAVMNELIARGADVNARVQGLKHSETPLHWAASNDDVEAIDLLLDHGANIEAPGAVIGGGTPLADAVAFGQWNAARLLVDRGARTTLWQAAALGLLGHVEEYFTNEAPPSPHEITNAFWCACHGGQRATAEFLLTRGADLNWIGYDGKTPLDAAERSGATDLAAWLQQRGARRAGEPEPNRR